MTTFFKQIFPIVLFVVLLQQHFFSIPQAHAVGAGEACCSAGTEFAHGACMKPSVLTVCRGVARVMTIGRFEALGLANNYEKYYQACLRANVNHVQGDAACAWVIRNVNQREPLDVEIGLCEVVENIAILGQVDEILCDQGLVCHDNTCTDINVPGVFNLCNQAKVGNNGVNPCTDCIGKNGLWTAVGCLPTQPKDLIPKLVQFAIGLAGGTSLMLMLIGAFRLSVSAGNPDALKVAKEMITNAIAGLIVIIFSAVLLQVIGVEILKIPGF